jgi:hypothetical protein
MLNMLPKQSTVSGDHSRGSFSMDVKCRKNSFSKIAKILGKFILAPVEEVASLLRKKLP